MIFRYDSNIAEYVNRWNLESVIARLAEPGLLRKLAESVQVLLLGLLVICEQVSERLPSLLNQVVKFLVVLETEVDGSLGVLLSDFNNQPLQPGLQWFLDYRHVDMGRLQL